MKHIVISGGISKDAVTRTTQQGDKVTGFSVGVSEGFGDAKRTVWFDVAFWGSRGEKLAQHLTKGTRVSVAGDLSTREHDGKTYLTVRASEVTLMGGGQRDEAPREQRAPAAAPRDMDDEIPF